MDCHADSFGPVDETGSGALELFHGHPLHPHAEGFRLTELETCVEYRQVVDDRQCGGQSGHAASVMSGAVRSAGLLPYRTVGHLEVLIAHPGGPWFERKDAGWWSLIKGIVKDGEDDVTAAAREFEEETGWPAPDDGWVALGETVLKSRKVVVAWAVETDFDLDTFSPGTFVLHGREYPEVDRVVWMPPDRARSKLNQAQNVFIDRLETHLGLNVTRRS